MGDVKVTISGGALGGEIQTNDGIVGMVISGDIDGSGLYVLGTPILITTLAGLATAGITNDGNEFAVRQVTDFYTKAGAIADLYLMLTPNTVTVAMIADNTYSDGAKKLLDYAEGAIKVIGLMTDDTEIPTPTIADGLNGDVYTAAINMAVMAEAYFEADMPFRAIIAGTSYNGVPGDLTDLTAGTTNNRTSIFIGDTEAGVAACMGLLLGLISSLPVQRKISRVKNGSLPILAAYVGEETVETVGAGDMALIAARGFITFKKYRNVSGYFFSADPTATATTDDYCMIARGRVIDKAHILGYTTFVQEVDDEVLIVNGKLAAGYCKWLSQQILNQVNATMTANGEISDVGCTIDPNQPILSTNKLAIILRITPVGYATEIDINIGYQNPALS